MAMSLRYVKPSLLKIVTRHCRPYSTQIDGLRLDENCLSAPRQDLNHYQELVTDKVSAILEEGKKLANSVCAKSGTSTTDDANGATCKNADYVALMKEANELHAQIAASAVVPYYHFYDSPPLNKEKTADSSAASSQHMHRPHIQSYSYAGDICTGTNENQEAILTNGQVLDYAFGVDTAQALPPHLVAYVRENTHSKTTSDNKNNDIDLERLLQLELQACHAQLFSSEERVSCSAVKSSDAEGSEKSAEQPSSDRNDDDRASKPSRDQLIKVHELMTQELPKILLKRHDYRQYRPDIIFENNFHDKPYTTKGIAPYVVEIAKLRMWAHFKYANVKMSLLKSTIEEDEGIITFHWRVSGVPQVHAFMFWKFLPWTYRDTVRKESDYHEGISTMYVDNTGLIAKHQMDKTLVDKEFERVKPRKNLRERLNKLLAPKPAIAYKSEDR